MAIAVLVIIEYVLENVKTDEVNYFDSPYYSVGYSEFLSRNPGYSRNGGKPFPIRCIVNVAVPGVVVGCSLIIACNWARGR